ncbi:hypothetical protein SAMN05216522_1058 [Rosenbergiella nectarea]|uniref:DUF2184 domain-containing protein n=1 Tax=Rosenbergiella nectarea TaxID=988801 RepID=A0A1H9HPW9_9GAMM|nr:major capsid family protein [Rosenbergiella nectarea]SEQ64363.1 hypothetical protein SAMN05216522_1058 [Rosenbergiella nectarea]
MSQMNYDEADLCSIQAAAQHMNMDEGESIFLARELEVVKATVYEKEYPGLMATTLFPVTSEIPNWAKTFTYGVFDAVGMARIIADYSDELPNVGANYREETGKIFPLGTYYEYDLQEIRASQATGKNLSTRLANASRRAHDTKTNDLAFRGDADFQIVGVLAHPNIPVTTSAGWTTAAIAFTELKAAVVGINAITKGLHNANVIGLPPTAFATLSEAMPNTATSYLDYFRGQYQGITIYAVNELEDIDGAGTRGVLVMERDADNASMEIPQAFEQLPVQPNNLAFKVPCHSRVTGVQVYRPLTMHLIKGI